MPPDPARSLLVVEDDGDIRDTLVEVLTDAGYTVAAAENGKVALEALRSGAPLPALVFLDLMMPVMDGITFCDLKRQDPMLAGIPVVVMSADPHAKDKLGDAVDGYLRKPMTLDAVLTVAAQYCG